MAYPASTLTFRRMPDANPSAATIQASLDALYTSLSSATDYNGTSIPADELWTWTRYQSAGPTTEAVYCSAIPSGTSCTATPRIIIAGASGAKTPSMLSPDTTATNTMQVGLNLRSGAFNAWDNAAPFTSGPFSGYYRWVPSGGLLTTATARVYASKDAVFLTWHQSATVKYWAYIGAIIRPLSNNTSLEAESDNLVYGMITSGSNAALSSNFLNTLSGDCWGTHSTTNAEAHGSVFVPGTSTSGSGGQYAVEWLYQYRRSASATQRQTLNGRWVFPPIPMCRSSSGAQMGVLREVYYGSLETDGVTRQNGTDDLVHVVGTNSSAQDDSIGIRST